MMDILDAIAQNNLKYLKKVHGERIVRWGETVRDQHGNYVTTPLVKACQHNNATILDWLFEEHRVDVNKAPQTAQGATPLYVACEKGDIRLARYLIDKGANMNQQVRLDKLSPLHVAIRNGHVDIVKELVKRGANVNILSNHGSALLEAARQSSMQCVNILLENDADINKTLVKNNETPLHKSAELGYISLMELLISNGADASIRLVDNQYTPLHVAVACKKNASLQFLLKKQHPTEVDSVANGRTPLGIATEMENIEAMRILIGSGADVNQLPGECVHEGAESLTPLMVAALYGHLRAMELLLSKGAKGNIRNVGGNSALHYALFNNGAKDEAKKLKLCTLLLKHKASASLRNKLHVTPFYYALRRRYISIVDLFLGKGASPDERDENGATAFHHLANQPEVYPIMAKYRADPNIQTVDGYTALHLASASYNTRPDDLEYLLTNSGATVTQSHDGEFPFHMAKRLDVVDLLKKKGCDLNARTAGGENAIHCAVRNRFSYGDIRKLLKLASFDVDLQNEGLTAMEMARMIGNSDIVRVLEEMKFVKNGMKSSPGKLIKQYSQEITTSNNNNNKKKNTTTHNNTKGESKEDKKQKPKKNINKSKNSRPRYMELTSKQIHRIEDNNNSNNKKRPQYAENKENKATKTRPITNEKLENKDDLKQANGSEAEHITNEFNGIEEGDYPTGGAEDEHSTQTENDDVDSASLRGILKKKHSAEEESGIGRKQRSCSFAGSTIFYMDMAHPSSDDDAPPRRFSFYDSPTSVEDEVLYDGYDAYLLSEEGEDSTGEGDSLEGDSTGDGDSLEEDAKVQGDNLEEDSTGKGDSLEDLLVRPKSSKIKETENLDTKKKTKKLTKDTKESTNKRMSKNQKSLAQEKGEKKKQPLVLTRKSSNESRGSPRKRISEGNKEENQNSLCDVVVLHHVNISQKADQITEYIRRRGKAFVTKQPNAQDAKGEQFKQKIRQAKMVILLLTDQFKTCNDCLHYCKYVDRYHKIVYPLKVDGEQKYLDTSLLDLMVGEKYHYDVGNHYEKEMDKLLHNIKEKLRVC